MAHAQTNNQPLSHSKSSEMTTIEQTQPNINNNSSNNEALCKLFVGNINKTTSEEEFKKYFEQYGKMKEIILLKDQNYPNQNRGFGFVTPETVAITDMILMDPNHQIDGREVDIKRAFPKDIDDPLLHTRTTRIFLGGLPHNLNEEDITNFFNEKYAGFGTVKEVVIKKERQTGRPRGFCFVSFDNCNVVDKILIEMRYPVINNKRCEVKKADPGVPITGVPPSQLPKFQPKGVQHGSTNQYPQQRMPYNRSNMGNGACAVPPINAASAMGSTGINTQAGTCAYDYNPYSNSNAGMIGYPQSNAYYGYYQNQASGTQYQNQPPYPAYGYSDQRNIRNSYQRSVNPQNITRGRPY